MKTGEVVTHQPAISFSVSFQYPFNRAGGRTSNVRYKMKRALAPLGTLLVLLMPATMMFVAVTGISLPWIGMNIEDRSFSHSSSSVAITTVTTGGASLLASWALGTAVLSVAAFVVRDRSIIFAVCSAVILIGTLFSPIPLILTTVMLLIVILRHRNEFFGAKPPPLPIQSEQDGTSNGG